MTNQFNVHLHIDSTSSSTDITISTYEQKIGNQLLDYIQQYQTPSDKIGIKTTQGVHLVTKSDIIFIEIYDKQLTIITKTEQFTSRMSLISIQQQLSQQHFVQISKSSIVNVDYISKVSPSFSGNLIATLINNKKVSISRRYVKNLTKILGI
ncbi:MULTISPECIES: LytTR family DNA-binding domain-containing protein [Mammaliicoccus]|uniref:LytTR family DNA-binding domain-containing protein n=1 Tax=Mammaliicoccus TaxID=2803850 RepID=UPI00085C1D66|nr:MULTISPECIES: LytTR family DNA-binding domain-containing protein [Mammaliicoccus]SCU47756.1 lytTr DNA-binding domain protein [Mammaliicoccus lentus]